MERSAFVVRKGPGGRHHAIAREGKREVGQSKRSTPESPKRKELIWLHGEVKSPPFTAEGRQEAGMLLRLLQEGFKLGMPQSEPLPIVGRRCGALRVRDGEHNWRIMYRVDPDVILVLDVYAKKTRAIPDEVVDRCVDRLKRYDEARASASPRKRKN